MILGLSLTVCGAGAATAHSPVPGIDGFYTGLLHPFSTPPQALLMTGTGLLCGQFAPSGYRLLGPAILAAMVAGIILGDRFSDTDPWMFGIAAISGALAALLPGSALALVLSITLAAGFLIGAASLPDPGPLRDRVITTFGTFVGANVALLYFFGAIQGARQRWTQPWIHYGIRVVAAWVSAIATLMLALSFAANGLE